MLENSIDPIKNTIDKQGKIRPDFLFSYWILTWFIFYYFLDKTTKYGKIVNKYASPIIALWIGFFYDFISFITIFIFNPIPSIIVKYSIMLLLIKIFPLYLLRDKPIHYYQDTISVSVVFLLYLFYLNLNSTNVIEIYEKTQRAIITGQNNTPFFSFMDSIYRSISSK